MPITRTRKLTTSALGPTVKDLLELLEGISPETRIAIHQEPRYNNPFDPGGQITFTVMERP
jgi:hypothetical protein